MELSPYHDEANDWLRSRGWLSRRSDDTWRDCFADDWKWFDTPEGYEETLIMFTGEGFLVHYASNKEDILLQRRKYRDDFADFDELKQHIEMIESWPPST